MSDALHPNANIGTAPTITRRRDDAPPQVRTAGNPFLEGAFAPVSREITTHQLKVIGELPTGLNGMYVRIGPNPLKPQNPAKYHWFTGDGMVHGIKLANGQAQWYRNRWLGSKSVNKALGRPLLEGKTRGIFFDTVNTNVYGHAGRIWASVEAGTTPIELDAELNSVRHGLFDQPPTLPFTAHPHLDPISGDLHAISYDALKRNKVYYQRINAKGEMDKVVPIPVKNGPMIHDCAITRSQVIVLDLPVTFSWMELLKLHFPYMWNKKHPARVGLLPRDGQARDIRWYEVDPCFVFHPCNAFDRPDGSVVLDVVVHRSMFDRSHQGPEGDTAPQFERWTLPAGGQRVVREVISMRSQEFPRLDERLVAQPYRYAYAIEGSLTPGHEHALLKHDLDQRVTTEHRFGPHRKAGEFVFVPRHEAAAEDEGWLVGFVQNTASGLGEFHVLDAQNMAAPAQAIVEMTSPIPMGFHGNWIAASALA